MRKGRRRGGEMRKGLVIGGMILGLLMGCNNGLAEELEKKSSFYESVANLGKGFLSVFTDLGDMVTGAFGISKDTTKKDVGKYFTDIEETMEKVKTKLEAEVEKNGNYEKVKTVVDKFIKEKLDIIASGAKKAAGGAKGDKKIGGATSSGGQNAAPAKKDSVNLIVNGIKAIVGVVLDSNEGSAVSDKTTGNEKVNIGKMLSGTSSADGTDAQAAAANASIGAVSGADILKAIANSGEVANNDGQIASAKDAAQIAAARKEGSGAALSASESQKDAVIAAGIALRAMAEDGEFAVKSSDLAKAADAVKGAAASAVSKTLSTLVIAIRNTVNDGLKTISEALASVNQADMLPETSESGATKK